MSKNVGAYFKIRYRLNLTKVTETYAENSIDVAG